MQLASKGLGFGFGLSANARTAPSHLGSGARSLHIHVPRTGAPLPPSPAAHQSAATAASRVVQTTRTALTRFFAHLTTPGFSHPAARSLSTRAGAAVRPQTIEQRLSFPARYALAQSRPRGPFLPRASPTSPSTVHVGLGTARNFSTARPIFQHLAQNVPVAGRAIYEADWDIERKKMKNKMQRDLKAKKQGKENTSFESLLKPTEKTTSFSEELEHYFPASSPAAPGVTTILLVPLAPTPTSRLPLSDAPTAMEPSLLPLSDLQDILSTHRKHSLRISSLFARLDSNRVWERGAKFTAHGDSSGLCTVLRIEFQGWTAALVREVLGDAGQGWCRLVEIEEYEDGSEAESGMSSVMPSRSLSPEVDPAASVVLPTLDFSASFLAASGDSHTPSQSMSFPPSPALSTIDSGTLPSDFDIDSELGDVLSDPESERAYAASIGSTSSWVFSSGFLARSAV